MLKTFIAFCLILCTSWSPISVTFSSTLHPHWSSFSVAFCPRSFKRKYLFCSKCLVAPPLSSALVHIDLLFLLPFSLNPHAQLYPFFRVSREPKRTLAMYPFFWSFSPNLRAFSFTFSFFFPFSVFRAHRADIVSLFRVAVRCFRSTWDSVLSFVVYLGVVNERTFPFQKPTRSAQKEVCMPNSVKRDSGVQR